MVSARKEIRILLADDDEDDCLLFEDVLQDLGMATAFSTVGNGVELMQRLRKENPRPDIVFLDLNMPLKNGFECLKEIRREKNLRELPVIIFSTSAHTETVDLIFEHGGTMFIRKPNSFLKFRNVLERILNMDWEGPRTKPDRGAFLIDL